MTKAKRRPVYAAPKRGPGRRPGARNRLSKAQVEAAMAAGDLMPLDYMLAIMRDEMMPMPVRFEAAKAAAPFCHSKLANIQHSAAIGNSHEDFVKATSC